jgi:hypothetical protein
MFLTDASSLVTESSTDSTQDLTTYTRDCQPLSSDQPQQAFSLDNLPTPGFAGFSPPFQDDPFKYSDFDFQCRAMTDAQKNGCTDQDSGLNEDIYEIKGDNSFVAEWPAQGASGADSSWSKPEGEFEATYNEINDDAPYGRPVHRMGSDESFHLSQVPPPPPRNRKPHGVTVEAAAPADSSIYSMATSDGDPGQLQLIFLLLTSVVT